MRLLAITTAFAILVPTLSTKGGGGGRERGRGRSKGPPDYIKNNKRYRPETLEGVRGGGGGTFKISRTFKI